MMKGKGKKGKDFEEKTSPPADEFKKVDLSKECPKYLEILNRNIEEGIKLEELDALQLEIETLLVSVVYCKRQLQDDVEKDKLNKQQDALKRSKSDERLSSKKFKEDQEISDNSSNSSNGYNSSYSSGSSKSSLREKAKKLRTIEFDETKFCSSYTIQNEVQNDIPNRFWKFVSTYCSPVKTEYLKTLEDLVSLYENEPDILKAVKKNNLNSKSKCSSPNDKTALELNRNPKKDDTKKKSKKTEKKKGFGAVSLSEEKSKKSKDRSDSDKCDYGLLTQRLVSCLIEEDFCAENFEDIFEEFSPESKNANDIKLFKTISLNHAAQFEKLLRKELEEHGLIDVDDVFLSNEGSENEEDKINQEIVKCQNELRSTMTQNQFQIKKLTDLVKADLKRQLIVERLCRVNDEVLEVSKRLMIIRQKRKNSKESKREKEYVQKYLKDRNTLIQQLNMESKC